MILQLLKKHQITQPSIRPWNSRRLRWLLTVTIALGSCPYSFAGEPATSTDPFLSQSSSTAQTWEELKTRSPEQRWESLAKENKRELKKQERKDRREQRKISRNSDELEFVPEFRQIPDDMPQTPAATGALNKAPAATSFSTPVSTPVAPGAESYKTIGLEQNPSGPTTTAKNLEFKGPAPVSQPQQIVPVFPDTQTAGSTYINTQNTYEPADPVPGLDPNSPDFLEDETPHMLKKIAGINPFFNYEPDPEIAKNEPCRNLCPRPDGKPCKTSDEQGEHILACPREFQLSHEPYSGRNFTESIYTWEASDINYNPLYFEDPNLERYGYSRRDLVQPFVSVGRFTGQLLALPYQMSIDPVRKKMYPLGFYRPGEPNIPKRINGIPWNTKAAVTEGLTATGLIFLLP
ncbi:hypothetical protein [Gimesia maris]|uniref:Uncharacterized protein n=1 Tax=Gimesia maris TaxID=122 RepID=A0ABX5YWF1_9PLAN|nr:hypothetical protein [Gimesia maris]QDU17836.1 hypothetical protein CA11_56850 [Gimesia maris]QEG19861.1 hypothetical protein GmarT_57680 [Gimesia maris]QGQ27329.1 hypothetical protein F1729_00895 [Gimesia maris]